MENTNEDWSGDFFLYGDKKQPDIGELVSFSIGNTETKLLENGNASTILIFWGQLFEYYRKKARYSGDLSNRRITRQRDKPYIFVTKVVDIEDNIVVVTGVTEDEQNQHIEQLSKTLVVRNIARYMANNCDNRISLQTYIDDIFPEFSKMKTRIPLTEDVFLYGMEKPCQGQCVIFYATEDFGSGCCNVQAYGNLPEFGNMRVRCSLVDLGYHQQKKICIYSCVLAVFEGNDNVIIKSEILDLKAKYIEKYENAKRVYFIMNLIINAKQRYKQKQLSEQELKSELMHELKVLYAKYDSPFDLFRVDEKKLKLQFSV